MKDIPDFIAGFQQFRAKYIHGEESLFSRLRKSQNPRALVISCCDSRVDPALLTGADPGDLFVIRNVANLVPPYSNEAQAPGVRSAIEFAVKGLGVERIIVLGHSGCGGIQALMDGEHTQFEFIAAWVAIASTARERVLRDMPDASPTEQARTCGQIAITVSLQNLLTFPWVRERVEQGSVSLHGWYFDIDAGELSAYSEEAQAFTALVAEQG
jgi:carbonic anhydrase